MSLAADVVQHLSAHQTDRPEYDVRQRDLDRHSLCHLASFSQYCIDSRRPW